MQAGPQRCCGEERVSLAARGRGQRIPQRAELDGANLIEQLIEAGELEVKLCGAAPAAVTARMLTSDSRSAVISSRRAASMSSTRSLLPSPRRFRVRFGVLTGDPLITKGDRDPAHFVAAPPARPGSAVLVVPPGQPIEV